MATLTMFWGTPGHSKYFIILLIVLGLLCWRLVKTRTVSKILTAQHIQLLTNFSWLKISIKTFILAIGLIFLFIALLSPQWNAKEQAVMQEGRDILIALDISRSMLAQDQEPNRLNAAKQKIKQLLERLETDRVALMLFSGTAFIQCPLTRDIAAFTMFLDHVDVETISSGTTALDQALREALRMFNSIPTHKSKIVLLITDGEDFSKQLEEVKKNLMQQSIHLFSLGMGSVQGAPIPLFDEQGKQQGYQLDKQGNVVISRLNEQMLRTLSQECGGLYVRSAANNADINTLIERILAFEKEVIEQKKLARYEQQYPWFIGVSLLCLLLEWLL